MKNNLNDELVELFIIIAAGVSLAIIGYWMIYFSAVIMAILFN